MAGIAGGITDFLLGWLFYGILFYDYFGNQAPDITYIALGCLTFGMLISYIFVRWANLVKFVSGLQAGAVIGLLISLMNNFFMTAMDAQANMERMAADVGICIVVGAIVGGVVAAVNGAMSRNTV